MAKTAEPAPVAAPRDVPGRGGALIWKHFKPWIGPILLFVVLRGFVLGAFHIWPTGSMAPTLLIDDYLFVNQLLYGAKVPFTAWHLPAFRAPRRDEIVIFDSPETPGLTVVKRIIGEPGDTLAMRLGSIIRNGAPLDEPYTRHTRPLGWNPSEPGLQMRLWQRPYLVADTGDYRPDLENWGPIVVPPDSFFVMGDNRDESYDSRFWGFLGRNRIEGRPFLIYFSFDRLGALPLPALTEIRFGRMLRVPG